MLVLLSIGFLCAAIGLAVVAGTLIHTRDEPFTATGFIVGGFILGLFAMLSYSFGT